MWRSPKSFLATPIVLIYHTGRDYFLQKLRNWILTLLKYFLKGVLVLDARATIG
jgi:hypothetical protein